MKHITMVGICLWSLVCAQAYASIYEGKVVGVSDGDTLTVLITGPQTKVRLAEMTLWRSGSHSGSARSRDYQRQRIVRRRLRHSFQTLPSPVPTQANCVIHRFPCQLKQNQFSRYSTLLAVLIVRL